METIPTSDTSDDESEPNQLKQETSDDDSDDGDERPDAETRGEDVGGEDDEDPPLLAFIFGP